MAESLFRQMGAYNSGLPVDNFKGVFRRAVVISSRVYYLTHKDINVLQFFRLNTAKQTKSFVNDFDFMVKRNNLSNKRKQFCKVLHSFQRRIYHPNKHL